MPKKRKKEKKESTCLRIFISGYIIGGYNLNNIKYDTVLMADRKKGKREDRTINCKKIEYMLDNRRNSPGYELRIGAVKFLSQKKVHSKIYWHPKL